MNGEEIFVGDTILVSLSEGNPAISGSQFGGIAPAPFTSKVLANRYGIAGFMVKYGNGFLVWEDDGKPAYEVQLQAAS